jgi:hypothetical protein
MSNKKTEAAEKNTAPAAETKAVKENKTEKTAEAKGGFCVYLGPTITNVVQSGTVYSGNKENVLENISEAVKKYPLIATLVVTDKTLSADRVKVKTPGNILYVNYNKLVKGIK